MICYLCGQDARHKHHLIFGSYRSLSDKYKLIINVCPKCHRKIHDDKTGKLQRWSKELGQRMFEKSHSREEFMKIFGKNFIK